MIQNDSGSKEQGYVLYVSSASQACNANNNGNANGENGVSNANYVAGISLLPSCYNADIMQEYIRRA